MAYQGPIEPLVTGPRAPPAPVPPGHRTRRRGPSARDFDHGFTAKAASWFGVLLPTAYPLTHARGDEAAHKAQGADRDMAANDGHTGHDVPSGQDSIGAGGGGSEPAAAVPGGRDPGGPSAARDAGAEPGSALALRSAGAPAPDAGPDASHTSAPDDQPPVVEVTYFESAAEPAPDPRRKYLNWGVPAAVIAAVVVVMVATSPSNSSAKPSGHAVIPTHPAALPPSTLPAVPQDLLATGTGTPAPVFDPNGGGGDAGTASGDAVSAGTSAVAVPQIPIGPISLSGWKLTLPVSKSGALSGKAKQLQSAVITSPWLERGSGGSLAFWAPATGATTSNSEHSRTELVSDDDFTFGKGVHSMSATLSVTQVPHNDQDIDVGQIHGGGSIKSIPFVMLHWRDGSIVVVVKTELHGSNSQTITLLTGVPLGARFSYVMTDDGDGGLTLTAAYNGQAQQAVVAVATPFLGTDERFQVGDYQQAGSGISPSDGGRVTFYAITTS
jgi:Alginate lyase